MRPTFVPVIVTYNEQANLRGCLDSLFWQPRKPLETVVVDVGGGVISPRDEVVIRGHPANGYSGNANIGVRKALEFDPDYVLMLGDDVWMLPWTVEALIGEVPASTLAYTGHTFDTAKPKPCPLFDRRVSLFPGNLWAIPAAYLRQCLPAPFDESLWCYGEDTRLCYRLEALGCLTIQKTKALAIHNSNNHFNHEENRGMKYYHLVKNTIRNSVEFQRDFGHCLRVVLGSLLLRPAHIRHVASGLLQGLSYMTPFADHRCSQDPQRF